MNSNERIYVRYFDAQTTEDDYDKGEVGSCCSSWDSDGMDFRNDPNGYGSVEDALKSVCEANCFKYRKECWNSYGADMGEDFGRFDGSFMVDEDNSEATEGEIEAWRRKERRLWACYLVVQLEVRAVRELTEDEAESFVKG